MSGWMGWDPSQTTTTTRAPLAVLITALKMVNWDQLRFPIVMLCLQQRKCLTIPTKFKDINLDYWCYIGTTCGKFVVCSQVCWRGSSNFILGFAICIQKTIFASSFIERYFVLGAVCNWNMLPIQWKFIECWLVLPLIKPSSVFCGLN